MEAVHEKSHLNTHLPELNGLWVVPPTQTDIVRTYHELVEAKGDLAHANELRFETGAERDFIDLSDSYVEINFRSYALQGVLWLVTILLSQTSLPMVSLRRPR